MTKRLLIFIFIFYSTLILGQTSQVAYVSLDITDSTGLTSVKNATVTFLLNDITLISNQGGQIKLTKFLEDTVIVTHWYLGRAKLFFRVNNTLDKELKILLPKSCLSIPKTNICPFCKSNKDVIEIIYGYASDEDINEEEKGKIKLGGCVIDNCVPSNYCKKDKFEF